MELSLACECGNVIRVSSAQCGEVAKCYCGKSIRVPPLRELLQSQPPSVNAANQSPPMDSDDPDELFGAIRVAMAHRGLILNIAIQICFGIGIRVLAYFDSELFLSILPVIRILAWILCLLLAFYIFRVLMVVGNLATAAVLALLAFIPFLNLAAALTASLLSSRHLKRFGYRTGFLGLSTAAVQELQSQYRRTKG